jgi:gluconokinase
VTIVVMGVAGVGKSTVTTALADRLGWIAADGDAFHSPTNVATMRAGRPLTDADRAPWLRAIAAWIGEREAAGEPGIVSCSALRRQYRDILRDGHPSVCFVHLAAPSEVVAARLAARTGHYMPPELQVSQERALEPLGSDEPGITIAALGPAEATAAAVVDRLGLGA